jgi:methionyl-tRNA formyltransferase
MRVVILSSTPRGFASYCLPALVGAPGISVAGVVFSEGIVQRPWLRRWRKLQKTLRIGPLGALNGRRMRAWYDPGPQLQLEEIGSLASRLGVPFHRTPSLFAPLTVELVRAADADVGLSLGNGFIPERVFSLPRHGMVNVHHELLPEFQGAQSVIWQLYHGSTTTGFTIHRIDNRIDTGDILAREEMPIAFHPALADTVRQNYIALWERSRSTLIEVLQDFDRYTAASRAQGPGRSYTTPSYRQFRQIARRHEQLREARRRTDAGDAEPGTTSRA